jgi:hypothetical protein
MALKHKDRLLQLTKKLESKGIYLLARFVVLVLLFSILFFPLELKALLNMPFLLGAVLFIDVALAIILLVDLLYSPQKSIGSLAIKYIYLTLSLILAYGLLYYINATIFQPPGVAYSNEYGEPNLEYDVFYISGATYFTVGYGDVAPFGAYARTISVLEAFTGYLVNLVVLGKAFQSLRHE